MRRTTNGYFGGYSDKPTFRVQGRWLAIRYLQAFLCLMCLPYLAIAANTRLSYDKGAPKLFNIEGGWGYIVVMTIFSICIFLSTISFFLMCFNVVLSPVEGFGIDVFFLFIWIVALAAEIVAHIGYSNSTAASSEYLTIRNTPRVAHVMTTVALVICVASSIYTTRLSYLQFKDARKQQRRSVDVAVSLVNSSTAPTTTPPPSPPQTARPTSVASSLWSRIRPLSSATTVVSPTGRDEEEPKPETEETPALTREQIIAQRIDAVRAPPTYWYATSNQPRRDVQHDPEAGDESLPLYRP
ncbi:hypothetical protein TWF281_005947 [Arthrobotrys megalospora]